MSRNTETSTRRTRLVRLGEFIRYLSTPAQYHGYAYIYAFPLLANILPLLAVSL